jgi:peptidyl-prolyl cis-trans isomerase B (cyclophilin B)
VASTKSRQRKLERDRYERKMVRLAQQQRRRRRFNAGLGAFLTLALLGVGTAWLLGAFEPAPEEEPVADRCLWQEQPGPERIEVGTPPGLPPTEGDQIVTIDLEAGAAGDGELVIDVELEQEPCGAATVTHLAGAGFYEDTTCHEITEYGALRCGDPGGTGEGGPTFHFYGENFPFGEFDPNLEEDPAEQNQDTPLYPAGTVAFADVTGAQGSQLLFFYEDYAPETPLWPILGTVTDGMDLLEAVGTAGAEEEPPGPPADEVRIRSVTVSDPQPGDGDTTEAS